MLVLVKDGNHFNTGRSNGEIHGIRELLEQAAPDTRIDFWELKRIEPNAREDVVYRIEKSNSQTRFLALVPARRVGNIKLGLRPKKESPHHPWDFRRLSVFRISSRISSQGRPSKGLAS